LHEKDSALSHPTSPERGMLLKLLKNFFWRPSKLFYNLTDMTLIFRPFLLLIVSFVCLFSPLKSGDAKGVAAFSFRPTVDQGKFFSIYDHTKTSEGEWNSGVTQGFAYKVLSVERTNAPKDPLVKKAALLHLSVARGFWDGRLMMGIEAPVGMHERGLLTVVGGGTRDKFVIGDPQLVAKFKFHESENKKFHLGFVPHLTIPTRFESEFASSSRPTGGAVFILESVFDRMNVVANLGAQFRQGFTIGNQRNRHSGLASVGVARDFGAGYSGAVEVNARSDLRDPFDTGRESLVEYLFGLKRNFAESNAQVYLMGGAGASSENGVPKWRTALGWKQSF
jgi:hypothetical protein